MTSFKTDFSASAWNDILLWTMLMSVLTLFGTILVLCIIYIFLWLTTTSTKTSAAKTSLWLLVYLSPERINLHKKSLIDPHHYLERYRTYRNSYNSLIRASKKLYYDSKFAQFEKNPKKIWNLLN
jgi:hypothetical protein